MSNRDFFINNLRIWWNASSLSTLKLSTFAQAVAYYDSKGWSDPIGGVMRKMNSDQIRTALESLANEFGSQYPSLAGFNSALMKESGSLNWTNILSGAAVETAQDVAGVAKIGLGIWASIAGLGFLIFFILPMVKKK